VARLQPPCAGSMWMGHGGVIPLILLADTVARAGDTSLYALLLPSGARGSPTNASVGLETTLNLFASMVNGSVQLYGTTDGTQLDATTILNWNNDTGFPGNYKYNDFASMVANVYYQNANIHAAMSRALIGGDGDSSQGCGDSQSGGCFSGNGMWPDVPFMWGNLDGGQVDPYPLGGGGTFRRDRGRSPP
jgi:hypothetical protein